MLSVQRVKTTDGPLASPFFRLRLSTGVVTIADVRLTSTEPNCFIDACETLLGKNKLPDSVMNYEKFVFSEAPAITVMESDKVMENQRILRRSTPREFAFLLAKELI